MSCMETYDDKYNVCPHCGYMRGTKAAEPQHMEPETILHKKYIVGKVIGFGGFGVTYIGWDAVLNTKVAIKEYLPSEFATRYPGQTEVSVYNEQSRELFSSGLHSFVEEAQRLAKFNSVNGIVGIYDTFTENNTAYIVMEYLEGQTLSSYIKNNGPCSYAEALAIMTPILEALSVVHKNGIIHRDISPDNIFITKGGSVKLLDFGASRYATAYNSKSLSVIVKRGYAPPEQYQRHGAQGPWTDNYAVAATMYKLMTGITPPDSMERISGDRLVPPSNQGVQIDAGSENALMNALNLSADRRPRTAEEFLAGLRSGQRSIEDDPMTEKQPFPKWLKFVTAGVAVLIIVIGVLFGTGTVKVVGGKLVFPNAPVQSGYVRVPEVIKQNKDKAKKLLEEKNLEMLIVGKKEFDNDVDKDLICEQNPSAGEKAKENSRVDVKVSGGPKMGYMPETVYYTEETAKKNIEDQGLKAEVTQEYSETVGRGGVISQNTQTNKAVKQGEKVKLTVSKGPKEEKSGSITIGNLEGKDFETARQELLKDGVFLLIKDSRYDNIVPENQILSQQQKSGTTVNKGDNVYVIVSLGKEKVRVPDVQYLTKANAENKLKNLNLNVKVNFSSDEAVQDDLVLSQSVACGALVEKDSEITINVNRLSADADVEVTTEATTETTTERVTTTAVTTTKPTTTKKTTTTSSTGTLNGTVVNSANGAAISNANIKIYKANSSSMVTSVKTNGSGNYSVKLAAGKYVLKITSSGFDELNMSVTVTAGSTVSAPKAKMVKKAATNCVVSGTIKNAENGTAVSGATIKVRTGINNKTGGYASGSATTNSSGNYSLTLRVGTYTLEVSKNGFATGYINVSASGSTCKNQNTSITPIVETGKIRIVLTWGETPQDLDSHVLFNMDGNTHEVDYRNPSYYHNGVEFVQLDYDERNSYGPETITLNEPDMTEYTYFVRNYSKDSPLAGSDAKVVVYSGDSEIATFTAPTTGTGEYWDVFTIRGDQIQTINVIHN